jgi:hypothetical protein
MRHGEDTGVGIARGDFERFFQTSCSVDVGYHATMAVPVLGPDDSAQLPK